MRRILITLALTLLIAQGVSAQRAAHTPRPKRYDPAQSYRYDRFVRVHRGCLMMSVHPAL